MKNLILKNSLTGWRTRRALQKIVLPVLCLTAASAFADTEQWLGVPGTTATTNWTDGANWTSAQQTYYNQVQFTTAGARANTDFSINNVLDATTGVAQMPIWELDYIPLNGNYNTLINPGLTLQLGAGWGSLYAGADSLNNGSPAAANAVETIAFTGPGATISIGGGIYLGQGSTTPGDTHNVTLDFSGVDNFNMNSGNGIYVASTGLQRGNGVFYLAKTNNLTLGDFQICNQNSSNSVLSAAYLGIQNNITLGGNLIAGGSGAAAGAALKFNPAVIGGAAVPAAYLHGSGSSGRIANVLIGNGNGGAQVTSTGVVDFSGGNIYLVADAMQIGQAGSSMASGTLTFDNNTIDVNNVTVGNQTGTGMGIGVVNLNNNPTLSSSSWLLVRQTLTLAASVGTVTPGTAGTVNVNGGSLSANTILNGGGNGTINLNNGTLTLGGTAGTTTAPISNWNMTNSTLTLPILTGTNMVGTNSTFASLKTGGATNIINISSAPPYPSYPVQVVLMKYASLGGAGFNFGIGSLPALYAGHLVNNTANGSIDIVFTAGSTTLTWNGNINGNWDTTTANWLAGSAATYADGQVVQFFDGASSSTVNLTATFSPSSITVSNNSQAYTFNGSGALSGSAPFAKTGSGKLTLDNSGNNNFTGGFSINNGTVQIGNNDANGNLPAGAIVNNGSLIFARSDSSITINNNISGSGSVTQAGGGTLTLNGANTFTGNVLVTNNSTLQNGSGSALGSGSGSVIVANGSTFDAAGNSSPKTIVVAGNGVDGQGAVTDTGGAVYGLVNNLTLSGDTSFNYPTRWDLKNTLSTGGNAYNLTLNSPVSSYFEWNNLAVDAALANIQLNSGQLGVVGTTTFGNPTNTLTLVSGAALVFYGGPFSTVNKQVDFQSGATIYNNSGANIMNGTMVIEPNVCTFSIGGTSLTLNNVLTGSGIIYQNGGNSPLILNGNSPAFAGSVSLFTGSTVINGTLGGSGITGQSGTTIAGSGTVMGLTDVNGQLVPGNTGVVGTFTAGGGLTLEGGAGVTMDLSSSLASSSNDLVQVNGDLTMNGNNISINPINNTLANGTYPLISYTGNFNGSIGTAATVYSTAYTLVLTNNTTAKQIQVIVSGTLNPSLLIWNNAGNSGQWDIGSSANWSNATTHASSSIFNTLDTVVLNDSILTAANPSTNIVVAATVVPAEITNNSSVNYTLSGSGKISGSGSLVKQGSGTLGLNVAGNFTGPVSIQGGILKTIGNNTLGSVTSITVTSGGTFDFAGNAYNRTNPIILSGTGANGIGAITNSGGAFYDTVLNLVLANDTTVSENPNGRWDFAIGSSISGAHRLIINANGGYGEIKTTTVAANVAGVTITNGSIGLQSMTNCQNPATVFTVANNATLTIWSGGFNGSLYLMPGSQFNLYSGTFTVVSGATLSGSSAIGGSDLVIGTGATISPAGTSSATIGTINESGSVTLNGTTVLKLNGSGTNDAISATANITYGGTLTLTNIGSPLATGNSFQLFNAASYTGTFSSTNLPALNPGLAWDLSQLNIGLVKVIAAGGSGPTIGSTKISGNQLIFTGTGGVANGSYAVLTSTNLANPNWTSVATNQFDGTGAFNVTNTITAGTPQQFYRIKQLP